MTRFMVIGIALVVCTSLELAAAEITVLHQFTGGQSGRIPWFGVTLLDSTLYGVTQSGGASNRGTLYKINTDGTGFTLLHQFAGGATDGNGPIAVPIISGSTLYGLTSIGGDANNGTIYRVDVDGSGYSLIHEFSGVDGSDPINGNSGLTLIGSTLYGTTRDGGSQGQGTVFKVNTDGSGFMVLHDFSFGANDGQSPWGGLTQVGSTLYGTTSQGSGTRFNGTIFKINTDGTGFQLLHEVSGVIGFPELQHGVVVSGSTMYGILAGDNDIPVGGVFKMNLDGTGYTVVRQFLGGPDDGKHPSAINIFDGMIYGTTERGGDSNRGTLYRMNLDGTGFVLLHEFTLAEGSGPIGQMALSGSTLFGTINNGAVYSIQIPEPSALGLALVAAGIAIPYAARRRFRSR